MDQIKQNRKRHSILEKISTPVSIFGFLILSLFHFETQATNFCGNLFSKAELGSQRKTGGTLLHERDPKLHMDPDVQRVVNRHKRVTGISLTKPADKINQWLEFLSHTSTKAESSVRTESIVKEALYRSFVITYEKVPASYYAQQVRIARERGNGDIVLTERQKMEMAETIIADQKKSLDSWTQYLISKDTNIYPIWLKFWIFTGMTKLSKYDPKLGVFGNRSSETVAPFAELNREALAYVADAVLKYVNKTSLEEIKDPEFLELLNGMNFGKLYGKILYKLGVGKDGEYRTNEGQWKVYSKGSDHSPLVRSLEGRNTGWCTAGESTAMSQLALGDFHVYYSLDAKGLATIPRVAIRMEDDQIAEVRGVAPNQHLDSQINGSSIVTNKLIEFGDRGKAFEKKDRDMRRLTDIDRKTRLIEEISVEDLRFLYEFDGPINSFGYEKDPRIKEIQGRRNKREDIARIMNLRLDQVSTNTIEALSGNIEYHFGDLVFAGNEAEAYAWGRDLVPVGAKLPRVISGRFSIMGMSLDLKLRLPEKVNGDFILAGDIDPARGLTLPKYVGGKVHLRYLNSKEGLVLPEFMGKAPEIHLKE